MLYRLSQSHQNQKKEENKPLVGNDKDKHGCIGSAGYTWCEIKQKCLKTWEEKCEEENDENDIKKHY